MPEGQSRANRRASWFAVLVVAVPLGLLALYLAPVMTWGLLGLVAVEGLVVLAPLGILLALLLVVSALVRRDRGLG